MEEKSKRFPAVMTTKKVLGMPKGTILKFDYASGKYVTLEEAEDVAADGYYYSGYAAAFDPFLVKDNVGNAFAYIEEGKIEAEVPQTVKIEASKPEQPVVEDKKDETPLPTVPETKEVGIRDMEVKETPKMKNPLVVDCACGHRHLLDVVDAAGINITIMAGDTNSYFGMTCSECGAGLKLWFDNDYTIEY